MLSEIVSYALRCDGHNETADFTQYIDKFFDCFNVSSLSGGMQRERHFAIPTILYM